MPYDTSNLFQTQADINQLAFEDPFNPVNMNQGQWGINSNLLTPSYSAIYRPQWQGNAGQGVYAGAYGGFWGAANNVLNPMSPPQYGGYMGGMNPYFQQTGDYTALMNRPVDRGMNLMQKAIVPLAAQMLLQGPGWRLGSALGRSTLGAFGRGVLGVGADGFVGGAVNGVAGLAGGFLGSWALPASVVGLADQGFKHYLTQRQTSQAFLSDFGITNFGPGAGNLITGQGLSREEAARLARSMDVAGSKDWLLDGRQYSQISDSLVKSGTMDNVAYKNMAAKLKEGVDVVKQFMSLMGTKDWKEATELVAQFKLGGASLNKAYMSANALNVAASIGGVTPDYLMKTVGEQGQYMFSTAGLTPYIGMNVASNAYASFRNAYRQGLLSPALVAQMGGINGMTQSYTSGMLQIGQTPVMDMTGYLLSRGKTPGNNLMGNLGMFGAGAVSHPLYTQGAMMLGRASYESEMLKHPDAMLKSFAEQMRSLGIPEASGKQIPVEVMAAMMKAQGMSDDAIKAVLLKDYTRHTVAGMEGIVHGDEIARINQRMSLLQQSKQDYGLLNPVVASWEGAKSGVSSWVANALGVGNIKYQSITDSVEKWWMGARYGDTSVGHRLFEAEGQTSTQFKSIDELMNSITSKVSVAKGQETPLEKQQLEAFRSLAGHSGQQLINGVNEYIRTNPNTTEGKELRALQEKFKAGTATKEDAQRFASLVRKTVPNRASGSASRLSDAFFKGQTIGLLKTHENGTRDIKQLYSRYAAEGGPNVSNQYASSSDSMFLGLWGTPNSAITKSAGPDYAKLMTSSVLADQIVMQSKGDLSTLSAGSHGVNALVAQFAKAENIDPHSKEGMAEIRKKISDLANQNIAQGLTSVNERLALAAKASLGGKEGKAALAKLVADYTGPLKQGQTAEQAVEADIKTVFKGKTPSNETQALGTLEGAMKAHNASALNLMRGVELDKILGRDVTLHMTAQQIYQNQERISQNAKQEAADKSLLQRLRQGVGEGVISYDTYFKTQVAQQEKKDYKTFSDAVSLFAKTVLKQNGAASTSDVKNALYKTQVDAHS